MIEDVEQAIQLLEQTERTYEFWTYVMELPLEVEGVSVARFYIFRPEDVDKFDTPKNYSIVSGSMGEIVDETVAYVRQFEPVPVARFFGWEKLDPADLVWLKHIMALYNIPVELM